jgi:hypothetical protein
MNESLPLSLPRLPASCEILNASFFSWATQSGLALISFFSLYLKWKLQPGEARNFTVWSLDAAKQGSAALAAHVLNIVLALFLSKGATSHDECAAYLVNFCVNVILGFPIVFAFLRVSRSVCMWMRWTALERRGFYGSPWRMDYFLKQTAEWIVILCGAKLLASVPLFMFNDQTVQLGMYLLRPLHRSPHLELVFVMILVPGTLNVTQILVFDNFIKVRALSRRPPLPAAAVPGLPDDPTPAAPKESSPLLG